MSNERQKIVLAHLSWFDLSNYEKARELTAVGWANALQYRRLAFDMAGDDCFKEEISKLMLPVLMSNPIPAKLNGAANALLAEGLPSVEGVQLIDVLDLSRQCMNEPKLEDVRALFEKRMANLEIDECGLTKSEQKLLYCDVNKLCDERTGGYPFGNRQYMAVTVNLDYADAEIIEDFKAWLSAQRSDRAEAYRRKKFEQADFDRWLEYRLLPYLDLHIFFRWARTTITQKALGELLFPEEVDVDLTERIRKVVKPMADYMKDAGLRILTEQAVRAERKQG